MKRGYAQFLKSSIMSRGYYMKAKHRLSTDFGAVNRPGALVLAAADSASPW